MKLSVAKPVGLLLVLLAVLGTSGLFFDSGQLFAAPTTFTVNSTGDGTDVTPGDDVCLTSTPGECTLRAALEEANADIDTDTIEFDITSSEGAGPHTIQPVTSLPIIVTPVIIDATTEAGFVVNSAVSPNPFNGTMMVVLDGSNIVSNTNGLTFDTGSNGSVVRGLVINNWSFDGIGINVVDNITIRGNYIGSNVSGLVDQGNKARGVGSSFNGQADNIVVGGFNPEDRNLIIGNDDAGGGNGNEGIAICNVCDSWDIKGNYIGVDATGLAAIGNEDTGIGAYNVSTNSVIGGIISGSANVISGNGDAGIFTGSSFIIEGNYIGTSYTGLNDLGNGGPGLRIAGAGSVVGGTVVAARNIISGNDEDGLQVFSDDNTVQSNYIGVGSDGTTAIGNGGDGIEISSSTGTLVGGNLTSLANVIANNATVGISVSGVSSLANSLIGNFIYDNGGLGIDLGNDGLTINDDNDADSGPNNLLNFPEYNNISEGGGNTTVNYQLDVPAGNYRIEFFSNTAADGSGNGEGENLVGTENITSAGGGLQYFVSVLSGVGHSNLAMTATLIDIGSSTGFGPTSEFGGPAIPLADVSVSKTIVDGDEPYNNGTIQYVLELTNNGPSSVDLSDYDGSGLNPLATALFIDIMPPELTYLSENSSEVTCTSYGPGSASLAGTILEDHSDHAIVMCAYTGVSSLLLAGESFSVTITAQVQSPLPTTFTNYAFHSATTIDPNITAINASFGSGNDTITQMNGVVNNYAEAIWPIPEPPEPATVVQSVGGEQGNKLTSTGAAVLFTLIGGFTLIMLTYLVSRRRGNKKYRLS